MKKVKKLAGLVLVVVLVAIQFATPARTNPASDPARSIHTSPSIPPEVTAVLKRSCADCHSNDTRWPWYSYVAPVSLVVVNDVNHGRKHLNLSEWRGYPVKKQAKALGEICEEVSEGGMPIRAYTWMHREAKLSSGEVQTLCNWARAERQRLASVEPTATFSGSQGSKE